MNKILVKSPPKVLVKAPATVTASGKGTGVGVDYDVSGKPVFVLGQGGGAGRGKTGAEKFFGRAGGALSALGGFLGAGGAQHRSIGSALSGGIGAGYQGAALGGQLGRFLSGRKGRALANLREQQQQDAAEIAAHKKLGIPLPKRLGGASPVKVKTSKPTSPKVKVESKPKVSKPKVKVTDGKDVTATPTDSMDIENRAAAAVVNAASKNPENRIEPGNVKVESSTNRLEDWDPSTDPAIDWTQTQVQSAKGPVGQTLGVVAGSPVHNRMNIPVAGSVQQPNTMAPDENALLNNSDNTDHDGENNKIGDAPPVQSTLTSSEEQRQGIANTELHRKRREEEAEKLKNREARFTQQKFEVQE